MGCLGLVSSAYFKILCRPKEIKKELPETSGCLSCRYKLPGNDISYQVLCFSRALKELVNMDITAALGLAQTFFVGVTVVSLQFVFLSSSATHTRLTIRSAKLGLTRAPDRARAVKVVLLTSGMGFLSK